MKKLLPFLSIFAVGFLIFYLMLNSHIGPAAGKLTVSIPVSGSRIQRLVFPNPDPPVGMPVKLSIPKIGVDASVEQVGLDSQGRMDVPRNPWDVAWYGLGSKPGQDGNAVIDGHLDTKTSIAVFYNLKDLNVGDEIEVTDNLSHTYKFSVSGLESYQYNQLPLKAIFASSGAPRLILITCDGTFNYPAENYSSRLVVYSDLSQS